MTRAALQGLLSFDNSLEMSHPVGMQNWVGRQSSPVQEFEFLIVVDGVSIDDEHAVSVLVDGFDAVLSCSRGLSRLAVSGEGADAVEAAFSLASRFARELPGMRLIRLDPDLVGISDIAQRTGRSRQNVLQWTNGERNSDRSFPAPEGTAGHSLVWRWADVNAWLEPLELADGERRPTRRESAVIDSALLAGWVPCGGSVPVPVPWAGDVHQVAASIGRLFAGQRTGSYDLAAHYPLSAPHPALADHDTSPSSRADMR
jgi:predicted DNA-binding transcriptional regulator AlpA